MALTDVLVDFDNLDFQTKRSGLAQLSTKIVNSVARVKSTFPDRCRIKLYGGWYEDETLSDQANNLIGQIEENSNALVVLWQTGRSQGKALVKLEMAFGLEVEPQRTLFNTLRTRAFSDRVYSNPFRLKRCQERDCPVAIVAKVFAEKRCSKDRCYTTPEDVFKKTEQKLVDTMITADLIYLGTPDNQLVLVSSDDDLWPGIQMALLRGAQVLQLHTRQRASTPRTYARGLVGYEEALLT